MIMNSAEPIRTEWQVLDTRVVDDLVTRKGAADVVDALVADTPSMSRNTDELAALAVAGKIAPMRVKIDVLMDWAERYGLRRLANALVELRRVVALDQRGQAILQSQALTRFIRQNLDNDIEALKRAVAKAG